MPRTIGSLNKPKFALIKLHKLCETLKPDTDIPVKISFLNEIINDNGGIKFESIIDNPGGVKVENKNNKENNKNKEDKIDFIVMDS